jgi:hypothetical protein
MLCTTAAISKIIAIPTVNQVVTGEITANRNGITPSSPILRPELAMI